MIDGQSRRAYEAFYLEPDRGAKNPMRIVRPRKRPNAVSPAEWEEFEVLSCNVGPRHHGWDAQAFLRREGGEVRRELAKRQSDGRPLLLLMNNGYKLRLNWKADLVDPKGYIFMARGAVVFLKERAGPRRIDLHWWNTPYNLDELTNVECAPNELTECLEKHDVLTWAFQDYSGIEPREIEWIAENIENQIRPFSLSKTIFATAQDTMLFIDDFYDDDD